MSLRGGGGGPHHHGGHGGFHGMYPPPWTQVGYPVAYQFYYGANQCPDTYCSVHDDKCVCSCSYRRPIAEGRGGGNLSGLGQTYPAYGFKSPWGVPLPADVWWAQRCPDTYCVKHNNTCGCECPYRQPKTAKPSSVWDVDGLTGLGAFTTFDKVLGGAVLLAVVAAFLLPKPKL